MVPNRFLSERAKEDWNLLAEHYDAFRKEKGTYNEIVEIPAMLELIGDVDGKTVLDAGCGSGYYSISLAKQGAKVTGIDISEKMIFLAKNNAKLLSADCKLFVGDIQDLSLFESNTFDLVTSSIVVGYVDDLEKAFSEVHRVLKTNGILTFSENHPILTSREEGWERDEEGKKLHFKIDNYYSRSIVVDEWNTANGGNILTRSRHRTVQDYFDALVSTGFVVERVVEPEPIEEGRRLNPRRFESAMRIPYFILFRALKVSH